MEKILDEQPGQKINQQYQIKKSYLEGKHVGFALGMLSGLVLGVVFSLSPLGLFWAILVGLIVGILILSAIS